MNYQQIEPQIDLNDPESGFAFSANRDPIELSFVDWTNRKITFRLHTAYLFSYRLSNGHRGLPEAQVIEILDSDEIQRLREDSTASSDEELHHFVISNNEDEWCEIVAERYELEEEMRS